MDENIEEEPFLRAHCEIFVVRAIHRACHMVYLSQQGVSKTLIFEIQRVPYLIPGHWY